ncbi:hypothetical protein GCM10010435_16810 [Winogradskya consettensis]|uniref:GH16 domain-containing protein n=1 Tax=Winogradskya consettensis TaxID=113560 RepID=A0A919VWX0_9ACTN|nr:glycoside hydrolase family 16 protein [Actinoplanes consettensis]GIM78792.1 hypothetical protein Aco04nite_62240 [Actinoplanes consettensis]
MGNELTPAEDSSSSHHWARLALAVGLVAGAALIGGVQPAAAAVQPKDPLGNVLSIFDPSGQPMPTGDVPGWKQVFADDFRTTVLLGDFPNLVSDKWGAYGDGWKDTTGNGINFPSKVVSVVNGVMDFHLRSEQGQRLVSAPVPKIPEPEGGPQPYGRYVVRFRADPMPGYKIAWLLWPDSNVWEEGEIDFPEGDLDSDIWAFMHFRDSPKEQDWFNTKTAFKGWHTAEIEWTPNLVQFTLDDKIVGRSTDPSRIPDTPMHWVLQTESNSTTTSSILQISGHVKIDWVTAYRMADTK